MSYRLAQRAGTESRTDPGGDRISPLTGSRVPGHIAIIMDGNGRWATQRGLPRAAGHRAGAENIRRVIERFAEHDVRYVTLFAFSTENWNRPASEVSVIFQLIDRFLQRELDNMQRDNVRVRHFGHIEQLPRPLAERIEDAVEVTRTNDGLMLNICLSYGSRDEIVTAVQRIAEAGIPAGEIDEETVSAHLLTGGLPDPDLVIRTAGEQRISNFLLWQNAYAELYFTSAYWPDFGREDVDLALAEYGHRKRKFGKLLPEDLDAFEDA
ncbi:MAG: isoprenyl transferase [Chloroflexi bacterium]|nr:isoprenyl transferase [Chloroflexota bacterium]